MEADARGFELMNVVIVGSGIAAITAASTLSRHSKSVCTTLITEETCAPYSKVALTKYVAGEIQREQVLMPVTWSDARYMKGVSLVEIDRELKLLKIRTEDVEDMLGYDALILAAGQKPSERFGVALWTLEHAEYLRQNLRPRHRVLVSGGGFIGVQLAQALCAYGVSVHLVESERLLLPGRVPATVSKALADSLEAIGAEVSTDSKVLSVDGAHVEIEQRGTRLTRCFDILIDTTGARPRTDIAERAGLRVSAHGIIVDEYQRTSDPAIFAAGDCAAVRHVDGSIKSAGLWHQAAEQGRRAALGCLGIKPRLSECVAWNTFQFPATNGNKYAAVTFGDFGFRNSKCIEWGDPQSGRYHFTCISQHKVTAYCAIGDLSGAGSIIHGGHVAARLVTASEATDSTVCAAGVMCEAQADDAAFQGVRVRVRW